MTDETFLICHVCETNIAERTPGFGVGIANSGTSTVFAWFESSDMAKQYVDYLERSNGTDVPLVVWDLCAGQRIYMRL